MLPEQGTGGPVERSRRTLSTSAPGPGPNAEGEQPQDADVQMQQPVENEAESTPPSQPSQESPRRCDSAPRATSSHRTPESSRTPSPPTEPRHRSRTTRHSSSPLEPPVTKSTLSELDVTKIIHNPKLRHDINFDPELHFRPNLDGDKGRKKQEKASQFWATLKAELAEFITTPEAFVKKHNKKNDWTLPTLLKAVKDIIQTLVPHRDRQFLDDGLNVDLLMQQFEKGIADLEKLALWLSQVLKSHCAPMRDDWVDTMYNQLSEGNRNMDLDLLVEGMRSLLSVLEAMKLDVANHQIRCLRPVLIEDTIHFEQRFFEKKTAAGKLDTTAAANWYKNAKAKYAESENHSTHTFGDSGIFFEGLSRLILPSAETRVPSTFLFDEERVVKLRADMLDAINLEICMKMYEDLERIGRYSSSGLFGAGLEDDVSKRPSSSCSDFNFNTPMPSSRPSSLALSSSGSATSSPRSSLVLPSYVAPEGNDAKSKSRKVYQSLVALLHSTQTSLRQSARWAAIAPDMALQIFRFTNAPRSLLATFEEKLTANICKTDSPIFQEVEQAFHIRLMAELSRRVRDLRLLSGVALFSVATGGRVQGSTLANNIRDAENASRDSNDDGIFEDMAIRIAHLGIIHWRVWSHALYSKPADDDHMEVDEPCASV